MPEEGTRKGYTTAENGNSGKENSNFFEKQEDINETDTSGG
jgi:hypothetical protein